MNWLSDFRKDVACYTDLNGGSGWKQILTEQGLWASLQYRIEAAVYSSHLPAFLKFPLRVVLTIWHKCIEMMTGISLPCTAKIGPGLHLPHCGNRVVNASANIGAHCCICQGVTIGVSGRGQQRGTPVVGDRVYFGVNAVVVGKIQVGDDVVIGANSLVNRDVMSHCTVLGVPAVIVSRRGSEEYLRDKPSPGRSDQDLILRFL